MNIDAVLSKNATKLQVISLRLHGLTIHDIRLIELFNPSAFVFIFERGFQKRLERVALRLWLFEFASQLRDFSD